jgi:peptide deformylase
MATRKIIYLGDKRLRQKAKKIKTFFPDLKKLAQDMVETMRACDGVGLAGPQIGIMQRIFVAEIPLPEDKDVEPHPQSGKTYVLINPEVIKTSKTMIEGQEGCLSIPTWQGLVERPEWIEVKAQNLEGHKIRLKADDHLARIFLHEIDHLNGILFIDHIKDAKKLWQILPEDVQTQTQKP